MRVAALFSGGKDSTLAAWVAENSGWDVTHLVTVRPANKESHMFHVPNLHLAPLQAEAWGKPLVEVPGGSAGSGDPENGLRELEAALAELPIDGIVSGALASEYQRTRLEGVGHRLGLKTFTPLWHKRAEDVLDAVSGSGWDVRIAAVAAEGLDASWLGKRIDAASSKRLLAIPGIHAAGEGGEYESLVLSAPFWKRRVEIREARTRMERDRGEWLVAEAFLA
ncbi:MAG: diphthine--ammonia ligase [Thermoplasmatota archaeon]